MRRLGEARSVIEVGEKRVCQEFVFEGLKFGGEADKTPTHVS